MSARYELTACPVCESSASREVASGESMRREIEELWGFQVRRLHPGVPVPHLIDRVVFSQDPPLRLALCEECGTIFRNPREDSDELVELYEDEAPDPAALGGLFDLQRVAYRDQAANLTRLVGHPGAGLEVGSYIGAFLAAARDAGWRFEGIDINESATRFACGRGLDARVGSLEEMTAGATFDAVAVWNCFDQLPDSRAAAVIARGLLAPGGILAIRVPNGGFYHRWRRRLGGPVAPLARAVLAHNNLLGFPYRIGFTPASLERLLRRAGFEPLETVGDALVTTADRWTRRWAAIEEAAVKRALRASGARAERMPWFEIYARAV